MRKLKSRIVITLFLSTVVFINRAAFAAPQDAKSNETITEISFRQACLCGPNGFINITLKADEPSVAAYFYSVAQWIETQKFFDLQDQYRSDSNGVSECNRSYSVTRGGKKKNVTSDCLNEPAELWGMRMVILRVSDDIAKERLRRAKEKQGVHGVLQNYVPSPSTLARRVSPLIIRFQPEPYQPGIDSGVAVLDKDGTFLVNLLSGSYRVILDLPDSRKIPQQLITVEVGKFLTLTVDAKQQIPRNER